MILVTGASGKVGSEAVRLLRQRDVGVRALVRDRDKAQGLDEAGAQVVVGDLAVPATLDEAMVGVDTVVLVSPAVPAQELNVVDSAARADVGHVVKITSKASLDSPVARRRGQSEIEAGLAASGVKHTLLRSNAYMQNFLSLAPVIAKTSSFGSSAGTGRVGLIDARDVAAVAAEIAAAPAPHAGSTYWLTGPALVSYADVAAELSQLLGRPVTYRALSFGEDRAAMIAAGIPAPVAEMNAEAFSLIARGRCGVALRRRPLADRSASTFLPAVRHRPPSRILLTPNAARTSPTQPGAPGARSRWPTAPGREDSAIQPSPALGRDWWAERSSQASKVRRPGCSPRRASMSALPASGPLSTRRARPGAGRASSGDGRGGPGTVGPEAMDLERHGEGLLRELAPQNPAALTRRYGHLDLLPCNPHPAGPGSAHGPLRTAKPKRRRVIRASRRMRPVYWHPLGVRFLGQLSSVDGRQRCRGQRVEGE